MIVTVTCNPAVDVTYTVDRLVPGQVHRVADVEHRPGGKGVNVARVLHALGRSTIATGFTDDDFAESVEAAGIATRFVTALPRVRQTLVVRDRDQVTSLWEPGSRLRDGGEAELLETVRGLMPEAEALVVSGSLPAGADAGLPARLAQEARAHGVPAIVDVDDEALVIAARTGGAVLTPNHEELERLLGGPARDLPAAAARLARSTGEPVVVTLGADGMLASTGADAWRARPLERLAGNPTGAGDAAAAAIAAGLAERLSWPETLIEAVAASAAAVMRPVAGEIDLATYRAWRTALRAERLTTPPDER